MWKEKYDSGWRRQKNLLFEREEIETVPNLRAALVELQGKGFYPDGNPGGLVYPRIKCFDIPGKLVEEARRSVLGEGISETSLCLNPCREENEVKEMYGACLNILSAEKVPT